MTDFYPCPKCGCRDLHKNFSDGGYCPGCGSLIRIYDDGSMEYEACDDE
jgi:hypothetical protein